MAVAIGFVRDGVLVKGADAWYLVGVDDTLELRYLKAFRPTLDEEREALSRPRADRPYLRLVRSCQERACA